MRCLYKSILEGANLNRAPILRYTTRVITHQGEIARHSSVARQ